jgi:hypothetical protein
MGNGTGSFSGPTGSDNPAVSFRIGIAFRADQQDHGILIDPEQ